jgi:hypothetical protein
MCDTGKDDGDDQLNKEEKEWRACDVQNPFITEKIASVRRTGVNKIP